MTPDQARDEMLAVFKAAWDTTGLQATYTDIPGSVPDTEAAWARVTIQHADGGQTGFGATEVKRFTNVGILTVQVFAPKGDGKTEAYRLAQLVLVAYCQARGSVWYRKQRIREAGSDGAYEQINVLADFNYDDQR